MTDFFNDPTNCEKTDGYGSVCNDMQTGSGSTISQPNHVLEINDAHADNWFLVIPRLPTMQFLSSQFNTLTKAKQIFETVLVPSEPTTFPLCFQELTVCQLQELTVCQLNSMPLCCKIPPPTPPLDCDRINEELARREANLDLSNFKMYLTDVNIPGVSIGNVQLGTQFASLNRPSKIEFNDLTVSMMVSENFINYNCLLYWLYALHNPEEYNKISGRQMLDEFQVELYLIITNNHRQKVAEYKFYDARPSDLGALPLTYKNADKITVDCTWKYTAMVPSDNFVLKYI